MAIILQEGEFTSLSLAFKINILIKRAGECLQGKCLFIFFPQGEGYLTQTQSQLTSRGLGVFGA